MIVDVDDRSRTEPVAQIETTRVETPLQQLDRHFHELLQELRVAQTGVQILFAFLLSLAFTPRFTELTRSQELVYLVTLMLSAGSAGLLIAPVAYHRVVYRRRLRRQLVRMGHRCLQLGLTLLMLSLAGAVNLAASFVIGRWAAGLAVALCAVLFTLWYALPVHHRRRHVGRGETSRRSAR